MTLTGIYPGNLTAQTYINPLPIPYLVGGDTIVLRVDTLRHNFNPNGTDSLNALIKTFAFNHQDSSSITFLGPSLVWSFGVPTRTTVQNRLPQGITVHWHGAHIPARADGNPHELILQDSIWRVDFPILDRPATMWYHPHVHEHSFEQTEMGMAGLIYVEDTTEQIYSQLPHSYGVDDFPIIIQERRFKRVSGELVIDTSGKNGNVTLVNGVALPYLVVPAQMVRFRVLNGSGKMAYYLGVGNPQHQPEPVSLIATDAGYTDQTYSMDSILMGPGVRTEWVLDLNNRAGDTLYLMNYCRSIPDNTIGSLNIGGSAAGTFMMILVAPPTSTPIVSIPSVFPPLEIPDTTLTSRWRTKTFYGHYQSGQSTSFSIDHTPFDMDYINDTVMLGATEIWTIHNRTNLSHPFHIHDVHFFVLDIWDSISGGYIPMPDEFHGPKDNVLVLPGWKLRFVTQFLDYGTSLKPENAYMYHCHILPHEDNGMMGQFVVWDGTNPVETRSQGPSFSLFPNPASQVLYMGAEMDEPSLLRFYDLTGRLVKSITLPTLKGVISLDIGDLPSGFVMVSWHTHRGEVIRKVLVR